MKSATAPGLWLALAIIAVACTHPTTYVLDDSRTGGPFNTSGQLTYNLYQDYSPVWLPDNKHFIYSYVPELSNQISRCLGIMDGNGGKRIYSLCDLHYTHKDSSDSYFAAAMRPNNQLLFLQMVGKLRAISPSTTVLWLADTSAPLHLRTELARFPKTISGEAVSFLGETRWVDNDNFISTAARWGVTSRRMSIILDTNPAPLFLIHGHIDASGATLSKIEGTEGAVHFAIAPDGGIQFVKGALLDLGSSVVLQEASSILRVPPEGGTATTYASSPDGGSIRGLGWQGSSCLFLSSQVFRVNPETGQVTVAATSGGSTPSWSYPAFNPVEGSMLYRFGGNLFRAEVH